jgi:hypothetical protein
MSYKPLFCPAGVTGEQLGPPLVVSKQLHNEKNCTKFEKKLDSLSILT